ncbi:MAG: DUF3048 domain-containing protein [Acidimicrobiales bacterium]
MLALALVAAACGGDDEEVAETTTSTSSTSTSTTTIAPSVAPTTAAPTSTTAPIEAGPLYPLSGEAIGDDDAPLHPAVVVKVSNNNAEARAALKGLDQADIIFEERIEQANTRFASVFHSGLPDEVGSVRSGRTSDVDIVSNLNNPIFAYSGANDGVHAQLRQAQNQGLLVRASADFADPQFSRIGTFRPPDNLVVDVAALLDKASDDAEPPRPIFDYSANSIDLGVPSAGVEIAAFTPASYVWDEAIGGYRRYQGGDAHVTREDEPIAPVNVIALTTTYLPSQIDSTSVDAVTIGSGPVLVFSQGFVVEGTWTREFARDPYTLETPDGQTIGLAPGQTWVSLTPAGTPRELSQTEADAFG